MSLFCYQLSSHCHFVWFQKPPSSPLEPFPNTPADPTQNLALETHTNTAQSPRPPHKYEEERNHITKQSYRSHNHVRLAPSRASTLSRASATVALYRLSVKWLPRPVAIQLRLDEDQGCGAWTRNPSGITENS